MDRMDVHSWSRPAEARVRHLDLDLDVRFPARILEGSATLHFDRTESRKLTLDTRDLAIHSVENAEGFSLGDVHPVLGAPLYIQLKPPAGRADDWVKVHYSTAPGATGLQWLDPPQTAGR